MIENRPRTAWGRKNLAFLKDPLIVNRLRINMPEPLEALGAILRHHVTPTQEELEGLNQQKTTRPPADLITRHFNRLMVAKIGHERV